MAHQDARFEAERGLEIERRKAERRTKRIAKGLPPDAPLSEYLPAASWPLGSLVYLALRVVDAGRLARSLAAAAATSGVLVVIFTNQGVFDGAAIAAGLVTAVAGWFGLPIVGYGAALILFAISIVVRVALVALGVMLVYAAIAHFVGLPSPGDLSRFVSGLW